MIVAVVVFEKFSQEISDSPFCSRITVQTLAQIPTNTITQLADP